MKWAETPAGRKEMQLKIKQLDFAKQKMQRGIIEESTLHDLLYKPKNIKEFVLTTSKEIADGKTVTDWQALDGADFAKACDGLLEFNEKGEVVYKACFAAGTLVHTESGLVPIERIHVGTRVLAQPEHGGEVAYKTVVNTVAYLDQEICAIQVLESGSDTPNVVFATLNHPFWVEDVLVDGDHWLAAECLAPGHTLQLANGHKAHVQAAARLYHTQHAQYGFAADARSEIGILVDLSERQLRLADASVAQMLGRLVPRDPVRVPVYNFEVEDFHTYYVSDVGVWVHNNGGCQVAEATEAATLKTQFEAMCFPGETLVSTHGGTQCQDGTWVLDIQEIEVGDEVLSRHELTGEMAYKRVTKVYCNGRKPVFTVLCEYSSEYRKNNPCIMSLSSTMEHPFWVKGKGWIKVCDLQVGDEFLMYNGDKAVFAGLGSQPHITEVFNIEVEDFHSYFVGYAGLWVHN